eukprot:1145068-Pelagomonas_calceolata.AAC.6
MQLDAMSFHVAASSTAAAHRLAQGHPRSAAAANAAATPTAASGINPQQGTSAKSGEDWHPAHPVCACAQRGLLWVMPESLGGRNCCAPCVLESLPVLESSQIATAAAIGRMQYTSALLQSSRPTHLGAHPMSGWLYHPCGC